jgi:DNA-binding beta-propeller fold protein YncE
MDDRHFDDLSRRVGELTDPTLPRRGLLCLLGGATLAGALGILGENGIAAQNGASSEKKSCKKEGKKCNKKKCRKKGKKCCCNNLKCQNNRCGGKSSKCGTKVKLNRRWGEFGSGDGEFRTPWGVAVDKNGDVYVADTNNSRIQVFTAGGSFIRKWGSQGNGSSQFQEPRGIGVNVASGSKLRVLVTDLAMNNIDRRFRSFNPSGGNVDELGRSGLNSPFGVAIDSNNNNVWVVDSSSTGKVFLFDRNGDFITSWTPSGSGELSSPQGIGVFKDNDNRTYVYVSSTGNNRVYRFEYTGNSSNGLKFIKSAGSGGSGSNNFNSPAGLAVDKCGNVWVADRINNRIQQLDKTLNFKSSFTSSFNRPTDVAISPNGKSLYVADSQNDRIQRFDLS